MAVQAVEMPPNNQVFKNPKGLDPLKAEDPIVYFPGQEGSLCSVRRWTAKDG